MKLFNANTWTRAMLLAAPVVVAQVAVSQLQSDLGYASLSAAYAQEQQQQKQQETRRTPALRNKVYERLSEAQTAAEAKNWSEASKILNSMIAADGKRELNSYELANVYNLQAFIAYSTEDYPGALRAYSNVIAQPDIPLAMEINTRYTVAQLYFVQEDWKKGIDALLKWFEMTETPPANAYVLLGQGYYQLKDYDKALFNTEKAISIYKEKDKIPKEQWYNLARFLYFEKEDIPNTVRTLNELLQHYPKKQYWVQLSHMFGEQKQDKKQLAAMDTAYVQGMLDKGTEQVTMAYLYLGGEVPYKAAKVMEAGLGNQSIEDNSRNYEILGNAFRQAQEVKKSIPAMEQAAAKSDTGELYARLGNIYLDGDQNRKAISAINKGLARGGVKRPDNARLVLGMAYFNVGEYEQARKAFEAAAKDERSRGYAQQWMKYMNTELERQAKLQAEL